MLDANYSFVAVARSYVPTKTFYYFIIFYLFVLWFLNLFLHCRRYTGTLCPFDAFSKH